MGGASTELRKRFISHNVHGMNDEKEQEILKSLSSNSGQQISGYCASETWEGVQGPFEDKARGYTIFKVPGWKKNQGKKGRLSGGFALFLDKETTEAWNRTGMKTITDCGPRMFAVRLKYPGSRRTLFWVNVYAPIGAAPTAEHDDFHASLEKLIEQCNKDEILLVSGDFNASMGVKNEHTGQTLGPYGIEHRNAAGERLNDYCVMNDFCAPTTFFLQRRYATWHGFGKLAHQIDHWIVRRRDLVRVTDARRVKAIMVESDHTPIEITIRLAQNYTPRRTNAARTGRVDRSLLEDENVEKAFQQTVMQSVRAVISLMSEEQKEDGQSRFSALANGMQEAEKEHLTTHERKEPGWFLPHEQKLVPAIMERNRAKNKALSLMESTRPRGLRAAQDALRLAQGEVQRRVRQAKNDWIEERVTRINRIFASAQDLCHVDPAGNWRAIKEICEGTGTTVRKIEMQLRKQSTGELCATPEESGAVMAEHLRDNVYNMASSFDSSVLEDVEQRKLSDEIEKAMDAPPTEKEVSRAIFNMKNRKAGGDDGIPAEYYKTTWGDESGKNEIMFFIHSYWQSGVCYDEWRVGRLKLLPKKGDLSDPNKWRGIMLLNVASKIISSVISKRLQIVLRLFGLEAQNGFLPDRGCNDASFALRRALQLRREAGLDTYVVFIDLVKAFDSVPRDGLFAILGRFGLPEHLIEIIIDLHADFSVKFKVGAKDIEIPSTVGVKQGDNLAPILFLFAIQACFESMNHASLEGCDFMTAFSDKLPSHEARRQTGARSFNFVNSLYADDAACLFTSRPQMIDGTTYIKAHMARFSLTMHCGRGGNKSKTEALLVRAAARRGSVSRIGDEFSLNGEPWVIDRHALMENDFHCSECGASWPAGSGGLRTHLLRGTRTRGLCPETMLPPDRSLRPMHRQVVCRNPDGVERTFDIDTITEQSGFRKERWPVEYLTAPFAVDDDNGVVTFCKEFRYLGSVATADADDTADVKSRCSAARRAFGALSEKIFRNRSVKLKAKRGAYEALVLSLMLYGCECWALTKADLARLEATHNACVRTICGMTMWHHKTFKVSMEDLFKKSRIAPLQDWLHCRQLQWLGHVARMDESRLPRRFLSTFVENSISHRSTTRPTYGQTIKATVAERLGDDVDWFELAQDRAKWRLTTREACNMDPPAMD